jgi:DNA-binding transcriptional regulator YdaS (Cro superfamily)
MDKITKFIKECGFRSDKDAAADLGVSQGNLSAWKAGKLHMPSYISISIERSIALARIQKEVEKGGQGMKKRIKELFL